MNATTSDVCPASGGPPADGAFGAEVVNESDVRAALGISRATLGRWIAAGRFPPSIKRWPGRQRTWIRRDLAKWLGDLAAAD